MVKFRLARSTIDGRIGCIEEWGGVVVSNCTPSLLLYTRAGHVPHLTWEVFSTQVHLSQPPILQLVLSSLLDFLPAVSAWGRGVASFCGIPRGIPVHLSMLDPLEERKNGYNDSKSVAVFTPAGKAALTPASYLSALSSLRTDSFETLLDYDIAPNATFKRLGKSVERTRAFSDKINDEAPSGSCLFAYIGGGECTLTRRRMSYEIASKATAVAADFVGFQLAEIEKWKKLADESFSNVPVSSIRVAPGSFSPSEVVALVGLGVDVFDSSWAVGEAEAGRAFTLHKDFPATPEFTLTHFNTKDEMNELAQPWNRCPCYTCTNYSTGYISHLISAKELLASILLVIHNLTEYDRALRLIRKHLQASF